VKLNQRDERHVRMTFHEAVAHATRIGGRITEAVRTGRGLRINLVHGGKPFTIACREECDGPR
jgi:hypothetical protein